MAAGRRPYLVSWLAVLSLGPGSLMGGGKVG